MRVNKMGLESFKTEGPRTRKRSEDRRRKEGDVIHKFKGTRPDISEVPSNYSVHDIVVRQELIEFKMPSDGPYFICKICGRVTSNFETIVKVDKLKNREYPWSDEVFQNIIEEFDKIDVSERLIDLDKDTYLEEEDEKEEELTTSEPSGLDAFKT